MRLKILAEGGCDGDGDGGGSVCRQKWFLSGVDDCVVLRVFWFCFVGVFLPTVRSRMGI